MNVPEYLQLPDPVLTADDVVENDGYFPDLSQAEFEQNYQVTDVFKGKTRYLLLSALVATNNQLTKVLGSTTLETALSSSYRMCVYAKAMQMACERYSSIDTKTKSEFEAEKKHQLALVYANEYRRLLQVLGGVTTEISCELI